MSVGKTAIITFKRKFVWIVICLLLLSIPQNAFFSIRIASWGPLELTLGLSARGSILLGVAMTVTEVLVSFLIEYPPDVTACYNAAYNSALETIDKLKNNYVVKIEAEDTIKRSVLQIKFRDIINDDRIMLNNGAYLQIEEDGRMVFRNTSFEGYLKVHYNRVLSIWNKNNVLIIGIQFVDNRLYIVQRKSIDCSSLLRLLFGNSYGENS